MGYQTLEQKLDKSIDFNINCVLKEATDSLGEVVIISGRQPKKNNPAIDILKKIWQRKRINGLRLIDQYKYDSYEKIEFDLNTIDSALVESKLFKGMEFIFDQVIHLVLLEKHTYQFLLTKHQKRHTEIIFLKRRNLF